MVNPNEPEELLVDREEADSVAETSFLRCQTPEMKSKLLSKFNIKSMSMMCEDI